MGLETEALGAWEGRDSCLSFMALQTIFQALAAGKHFGGSTRGPSVF